MCVSLALLPPLRKTLLLLDQGPQQTRLNLSPFSKPYLQIQVYSELLVGWISNIGILRGTQFRLQHLLVSFVYLLKLIALLPCASLCYELRVEIKIGLGY